MRKLNSKFMTNFVSEAGTYLQNKDYFAFVELDKYACYVIADGIDEDKEIETAKIAVTEFIKRFTEKPSMNNFIIKKYLKEVNEEVINSSRNVRLKASITVVITNYSKLKYYTIGNTRFYLFKDGYLKLKSKDESVTQQMADKELIPLDKMAKHIERNNLTTYLGEDKLGKIYVSKSIKLNDKDVFVLLTRGIWENCDAKEIEDALEGAKEPKEVVDNVEDIILSKQPKDLQNYTLAVTFAEKVYVNPEKKKLIKKILMIAIPIIILLIVLLVVLHIKKNNKINAIAEMNNYEASAEEYIKNDNVEKANTDLKNALDIAKKYKLKEDTDKLDDECKYVDLIMQGDKYLEDKKYEDALDKYMQALDETSDYDNLGKDYIDKKIDIVKNCITVADLLTLADQQLEGGDDKAAEDNYLEAKKLALNSYLKDEKKEAMDKLQKIYDDRAKAADDAKAAADKDAADKKAAEDKAEADKKAADEAAKKAEEETKKEKEKADEKLEKAAEYRKNGDNKYVSGDYISARMYYTLALQAYKDSGDNSTIEELQQKIVLMDKKIDETADRKSEADRYVEEANTRLAGGDQSSAKALYIVAKDIYNELGYTDEAADLDNKISSL